MNKHLSGLKIRRSHLIRRSITLHASLRVVILAALVFVGGMGIVQQVEAAQTSEAYCSQFTTSSKLNACQDGIKGADCNDYAVTFDEEHAKICRDAASADISTPTASPTVSSSVKIAPDDYKNAVATTCNTYMSQGTATYQACLYGGSAQSGVTTISPKTNQDCLSNADYKNSTKNQQACIAGSNSGIKYIAEQEKGKSGSSTLPSTINPTVYKNTVLAACGSYKNNTPVYNACLYGGSAQSGSSGTVPKTNQECLTNADYKNSTAKQRACIAGSTAGQKYVADQATKTPGASSNPFAFLEQLEQTSSLSDYVDTLHANGQDKGVDLSEMEDDSSRDSYINGAGKKQKIEVIPCAGGGGAAAGSVVKSATNVNGFKEVTSTVSGGGKTCPAIIFFNGGGWHADDQTSKWVAQGSSKRNGTEAEIANPPGGGATQRGFTSINVTYRLGSSSVYYAYEDVMRGLQHVISNADLYGIDPTKIAIWGDSAGGSLAMRAAASGKSGAKVAVGWSAPTNAYTVLFRSYKSFLIGMDHSTCIPTDLAGLTNTTDLLNGGSGDVAQYGQGITSNNFDSLGLSQSGGAPLPDGTSGSANPLGIITEVLTAGQYAAQTGQNVESISKQLESGGIQGLSGGVMNLASKKFGECIDNFNALSPALFASPETPPSYLAGFENDDLIGPDQSYGMRDKLLSLGIRSEALVLPGDPNAGNQAFGASGNHLGYNPLFVCPTLNFIISVMDPDNGGVNCETGVAANQSSTDTGSSGGSGTGTGGGGGATTTQPAAQTCEDKFKGAVGRNLAAEKRACQIKEDPGLACTSNGGRWIANIHGKYSCAGANGSQASVPAPAPTQQQKIKTIPGWSSGNEAACKIYIAGGSYNNARWNGANCVYEP